MISNKVFVSFVINIMITKCGLILILFGFLINLKYESRFTYIFEDFYVGIFTLCVGAVQFIVGCMGCYGIYNENKCLITAYILLFSILCPLQLAAGIAFLFLDPYESLEDHKDIFKIFYTKFNCCHVDCPLAYKTSCHTTLHKILQPHLIPIIIIFHVSAILNLSVIVMGCQVRNTCPSEPRRSRQG